MKLRVTPLSGLYRSILKMFSRLKTALYGRTIEVLLIRKERHNLLKGNYD